MCSSDLDKEPAASRSRTHITIERDQDGRPREVERRDDYLPPLLAEKDKSPRRPWNIRLSATALAVERESERTTPATESTDSTDPWCWKKKTSWVPPALDPTSEMSPSPKGSRSPETRPNIPAS